MRRPAFGDDTLDCPVAGVRLQLEEQLLRNEEIRTPVRRPGDRVLVEMVPMHP
ncbi:hypothetical protein [Amycolatopsis sp. lyj-346]|uniref:hypothetical protein n=1 Tax=Amycolatopsis sp. lyj-346 TaxID=2789289 RepID=UPI00397A94E4